MPPKADKSDSFSIGSICLGKLKGYPAWPCQVIDNKLAPANVKREKVAKGTHLVQFFPTGDYSFIQNKDLAILKTKEIEKYVNSSKKDGELLQGYRVAQDPTDWQATKDEQRIATDAQYEEDQLRIAEYAANNVDDEAMDTAPEGGKKRKREEGSAKKKESAAEAKKRKKAEEPAAKKNGTARSKKLAANYTDDEAEPSKKAKTAEEDADLTQVKDWRHKLQKVFLGKGAIAADEMVKCSEYFEAMESFAMNKDWLAESKLGKVLKRIGALTDGSIPRDAEFNFRTRATALATKWNKAFGGEGTPVVANGSSSKDVEMEVEKAEEVVEAPEAVPEEVVEEQKPVEAVEPAVVELAVEAPAAVVEAAAPAVAAEVTEEVKEVAPVETKEEIAPVEPEVTA